MQNTDDITELCFNAVRQIQQADSQRLPEPSRLHAQLRSFVDQVMHRAKEQGVAERDADDMRYALVALADEVVLSKGGALRDYWLQRTLQMHYYSENIAGEMFFQRLEQIQADPSRHRVLRVFYLCLLFGFQGRYRIRGGELTLADIQDRVKNDLTRVAAVEQDGRLSPHGSRPREPATDVRRHMLVLWIALAGAMASLLLFVVLRLRISQQAIDLVERITALVRAP